MKARKEITRRTFLIRFKQNCKELLKSDEERRRAIRRLNSADCPFSGVCRKHIFAEQCGKSCPDLMPAEECPVSKKWYGQIRYFWHRRWEDSQLRSQMIAIVEGLTEGEVTDGGEQGGHNKD